MADDKSCPSLQQPVIFLLMLFGRTAYGKDEESRYCQFHCQAEKTTERKDGVEPLTCREKEFQN